MHSYTINFPHTQIYMQDNEAFNKPVKLSITAKYPMDKQIRELIGASADNY